LVGRETYEQVQDSLEARPVGQLKLRRHPEPITAYEVLARQGTLAASKMHAIARYLEGLEHFQVRRWEQQALSAFTEALRLDPSDGPSRFYQERCEALLAAPPEVSVL
jgi:hypothetical protein